MGSITERERVIMSEIIGNIVDIDTRRDALAILEDAVQRMRLWETPYDLDCHFVKDIDEMIRQEEQEDDLDSQIYIMAQCVKRVTEIIDRIEHGEED